MGLRKGATRHIGLTNCDKMPLAIELVKIDSKTNRGLKRVQFVISYSWLNKLRLNDKKDCSTSNFFLLKVSFTKSLLISVIKSYTHYTHLKENIEYVDEPISYFGHWPNYVFPHRNRELEKLLSPP